jgi:peroxiredoxin Q/BCP
MVVKPKQPSFEVARSSMNHVKNRRALVSFASAVLAVVVALVALSVVACGQVKRPDGGVGLLPNGAVAPDVVGHGPAGEVRLSALRGKAVVVYFYPQDETPGCTKEACAFRDAWNDLEKADIAVMGVSTNSAERHQAFQQKHQLPFALASDDSGDVGAAYGVSKKLWGYDRVTFLIGRDGRVAHVWPSVDPGIHAREVIDEASHLP